MRTTKTVTVAVYLCAAVALAVSIWGDLWAVPYRGVFYFQLGFIIGAALISAPAVLLAIVLIRWLREPGVGAIQRRWSAVLHSCAGIAVLLWVFLRVTRHVRWGMSNSLIYPVLLIILGSLSIILCLLAIFRRGGPSPTRARIAVLVTWTYLFFVCVYPGVLYYQMLFIIALASPLIFALAATAIFFHPRFGYILGAASGLGAAAWLFSQEITAPRGQNSWIYLNGGLTPSKPREMEVLFAELRLLAITLVLAATVLSLLRLLPPHWTLRSRPLCERTWPAFAIVLALVPVWCYSSAAPYRVPGAVDALFPQLAILHVEKRGLQFHELTIAVEYTGEFLIWRNDRRLFGYGFDESSASGRLPTALSQQIASFPRLTQPRALHGDPWKPLRAWNAEGWYVVSHRSGWVAFTSEYGTSPPNELVKLFDDIRAAPVFGGDWQTSRIHDVCLGFCYDPLAGLGFDVSNQRCHTGNDGITRCQ